MALLKVYNGTSWDTSIWKAHNGSAWDDFAHFWDGTAWVPLVGLHVSPNTANVSTGTTSPDDAFAGVQYKSDGNEWSSTGGGTFSVGRGQWLDIGSASAVWVERTVNSGSLNWQDPGTGRKVLSTTRTYGVTDTSVGGGPVTANVTFDFYDAASGGNLLDSVTLDLTAEKTI